MSMDIKSLNALRRSVKESWEAPGERPKAIIHLSNEDGDREAVSAAFRTIASEMGLRHLSFDLQNGFSDEHKSQLLRKGPRLVVIHSIDGVAAEDRGILETAIRDGGRTVPVCICFMTAADVERIAEATSDLRRIQERTRRFRGLMDAEATAT